MEDAFSGEQRTPRGRALCRGIRENKGSPQSAGVRAMSNIAHPRTHLSEDRYELLCFKVARAGHNLDKRDGNTLEDKIAI